MYNFSGNEVKTEIPLAHYYKIVVFLEEVPISCRTEGWYTSFILHEEDLKGTYAFRYVYRNMVEIPYCKYYNLALLGKVGAV